MNFFMNLFRSTSPAWKQINAKPLTTKNVKIVSKVVSKKVSKLNKSEILDNNHALSDALIILLRENNYNFEMISLVLNVLKIKPMRANKYTCHVAAKQYARMQRMCNDNDKNAIN